MMSASTVASNLVAKNGLPPEIVIFGRTTNMMAVQQKLEKVSVANVPILIEGESGTGKEIITKLIHQLSPWGTGPFVKVNCPAIPGTLIESELFGYERGAFTGAYGAKAGRVEMASRGTLFLDEIGELDMDLQAKLLQVLQDGQFCRIGSQEDKRLEARVVCATNRSLEQEIAAGTFRQDLYYRINVVSITLPPLRDRKGDIPELVDYFLQLYNEQYGRAVPSLPPALLQRLQAYHWPGNIRELENFVERAVILTRGTTLQFPIDELKNGSSHSSASVSRSLNQRDEIVRILKESNGQVGGPNGAAARLGLKRTTLISRMKKLGINFSARQVS